MHSSSDHKLCQLVVCGNLSERPAGFPQEKQSWFLGKYGFNLKQNGIDGRAPPGMSAATKFDYLIHARTTWSDALTMRCFLLCSVVDLGHYKLVLVISGKQQGPSMIRIPPGRGGGGMSPHSESQYWHCPGQISRLTHL